MRDFTNVRWDADQQRWSGGTGGGASGGRGPVQLIVPVVALTTLIVLIALVAIGFREEGLTDKTDQASATTPSDTLSDEESSGDECTNGSGGDHCDGGWPEGFGGGGPEEENQGEQEEQEEEVGPEPENYVYRMDPEGFELNVPQGWERREKEAPEGVLYHWENERYLVQVKELWADPDTPRGAMDRLKFRARDNRPEYEERDLRDLSMESRSVELDYVYEHEVHGPRAVSLRTFLGGDNEVHAIQAEGPEEEWELTQKRFKAVIDSYCVTGHDCP